MSLTRNLFALIAGAALPFAFAPFGFYPLAVICAAILLLSWLGTSPQQAFWRGMCFGIGFFGVGVSWVYISIHQYGNTDVWLAVLITALFVVVISSYIALQGYLFARFFPKNTFSKLCLVFPASWVLQEWIRGWLFTGFPWLLLGASQTHSPLNGFAPIIGEYGLSFVITFIAGLFVFAGRKFEYKKMLYVCFILIAFLLSGIALGQIEWTQPEGKAIKVSLVQGNIPQPLKWDRAYLETTLNRYYELTQKHWDSRIIIWPEAAIPLLQKEAQGFINLIDQQAKQHNTTVITGLPIQEGMQYYNGMIAIGVDHATYYKRHLVPFGEYIMFDKWLRGLIGFFSIPMSDFSPGPAKQADFQVDGLTIAPFICYEVVYPNIVLSEMPKAQILVTISDDAWFGHSYASAQHLQISTFMAQATGRYLIFSTNDGITAIVTPKGQIQQQIPRFEAGVLTDMVYPMVGSTPWIKMGDMPILILMVILVGIGFWENRKNS